MIYEDKIQYLSEEDFFSLFLSLGVAPRWVNSAGKRSIQMIGKCHNGDNHSAVFDPTTLKVTCFSECGGGMYLHTWIMRALGLSNVVEAKDWLEDWMDGKEIDWDVAHSNVRFEGYQERPYEPEKIEPLKGMEKEDLDNLFATAEGDLPTLAKLVWAKIDGISPEIMQKFDVKFDTSSRGIFLPHHNILGDIVGVYLRSFLPLRKQIKEKYPDMPYSELVKFPRAKYVPALRPPDRQEEEKTSWSFPNSKNLYGLHLAHEEIEKSGIAIIFEGGKSVMLGHQYGYPYCVATHTYGAHLNHISMLIEAGAKEIVLAFDKQYEDENGKQYELYEHKTRELAKKIRKHVNVSRMASHNNEIDYKDAPIDRGKDVFIDLFEKREKLAWNGEMYVPKEEPSKPTSFEDRIPKVKRDVKEEDFSGYRTI